jgi:hypothetical protein
LGFVLAKTSGASLGFPGETMTIPSVWRANNIFGFPSPSGLAALTLEALPFHPYINSFVRILVSLL